MLFCATLSLIFLCDSCTDLVDAKDDANSFDLSWLAMGTRSMEYLNLVLNIYHKEKEDGAGNKGGRGWWPKQVTTVRIGSRGGGEGGVGSRAGKERDGWQLWQQKRIAVAAEKLTNLLNHRSVRLRCFYENFIDGNLKLAWVVGNNMLITLAYNLGICSFDTKLMWNVYTCMKISNKTLNHTSPTI